MIEPTPIRVADELESAVRERRVADTARLLKLVCLNAPECQPSVRIRLADALARATALKENALPLANTALEACASFESAGLALLDVARLDLARGIVLTTQSRHRDAAEPLSSAVCFSARAGDTDIQAVAHYYLARGYRKTGDMEGARNNAEISRRLDIEARNEARAAVTLSLLAWLDFMTGQIEPACDSIREAESTLSRTDDNATKADMAAFHGRLDRRRGQYDRSAHHFEKAVRLYQIANPGHRNLARARINYALVLLMQARKLHDDGWPQRSRALHDSVEQHLSAAEAIYRPLGFSRGMAAAQHARASLAYERSEYAKAQVLAHKAYSQADGHHGVLANSMILMALAEAAKVKNGNRAQALTFAGSARHHAAHQPGNKRLDARVRIVRGIALLLSPAPESARAEAESLYREALDLLTPSDQDYIRDELEQLRRALADTRSPDDPVLVQVRASDLINRSLADEILPEIGDAILRAAYEQNGRKVSRTAKALHCGPKRVRDALDSDRAGTKSRSVPQT